MSSKVAVVTGSNKGIGLGTVKELLNRGVSTVYLTARDVNKGINAVEKLKKEGVNPHFHQLDVTDKNSVKTFADHLKTKHGEIDILINNAGVASYDYYNNSYEEAKRIINVNYRSIFTIEEYIFPILKDKARVINISSDCGHISNLKNKYWIERLTKPDLKIDDIEEFVDWFLDSTKNGTVNAEDFAETTILAYRISKIALCAWTRIKAKSIGRNISINSMHPGLVKTDMTQNCGNLTIEESGKTPAYLALDIDQSVKGKYFWFDKTEKEWSDPSLDLYFKFDSLGKLLKDSESRKV